VRYQINVFSSYDNSSVEGIKEFILGASFIDPTFVRQKIVYDTLLYYGGLAPRIGYASDGKQFCCHC
jgi:hypothetical protein